MAGVMIVAGCFLEFDGKFVILKRHADSAQGNTWGLPAGKVETNEDKVSAILREVAEETGYQATTEQLEHLGDFTFDSEGSEYTFATYRVSLAESIEIKLDSKEHTSYDWITPEECYARQDLINDFHDLLKLICYVKE